MSASATARPGRSGRSFWVRRASCTRCSGARGRQDDAAPDARGLRDARRGPHRRRRRADRPRSARKRRIGLVFQQSALWPHPSGFDHVAFGLRARGDRRGDRATGPRATRAGRARGVDARRPSELSSSVRSTGSRWRARSPSSRASSCSTSRSAPLEAGGARGDAAPPPRSLAQGDRDHDDPRRARSCRCPVAGVPCLAVLSGGTVVQEGLLEDVYWRPKSRVVADLVGVANLVPVRVVELREVGVVVGDGGPRARAGGVGRPRVDARRARAPVPADQNRWWWRRPHCRPAAFPAPCGARSSRAPASSTRWISRARRSAPGRSPPRFRCGPSSRGIT